MDLQAVVVFYDYANVSQTSSTQNIFFYLKWIQTHELCDTGAVLYQLSYQPSWELVTLRNCNIPVNDQ